MPVIALTDPDDARLADYLHLTDVALRRRLEPHVDPPRPEVAQAIEAREPYLVFWKLPAWKPFWQNGAEELGCWVRK